MQFLHQLTSIKRDLVTDIATTVEIPNPPYMTLTVENIGPGPRHLPALSICHYGEQNGDAMRDPEMCFEMEIEDGKVKEFHPYYYRNDYMGVEQWSRNVVRDHYVHLAELHKQHERFAKRGTTTCVCRDSPRPSSGKASTAPSVFRSVAERKPIQGDRSANPHPNPRPQEGTVQNSSEFQYIAIDTIHESATKPRVSGAGLTTHKVQRCARAFLSFLRDSK